MHVRTATAWILFGLLMLVAAPAPTPAAADGDPLEEYDFSGSQPPEVFVQQSRTCIYRHGLWTLQRHVDLDPFAENGTWDLKGCTNERINIYYGTRPMWSSQRTYRAHLPQEEGKESVACWRKVRDTLKDATTEAPERLAVVAAPGGKGILLKLRFWNGGASGGSSSAWIRLTGSDPASAKVETLWRGSYETVTDLDGDGTPEIIDSDRTHEYASYLPHKGVWARVVLTWHPQRDRFVVANDRLYARYLAARKRVTGEPVLSADAWVSSHRDYVRESLKAYAKTPDDAHARELVVLNLGSALTSLLWSGHVKEAKALLEATELPHFGSSGQDKLGKAAWWQAYVAGCKSSPYWDELVALFPALAKLGA